MKILATQKHNTKQSYFVAISNGNPLCSRSSHFFFEFSPCDSPRSCTTQVFVNTTQFNQVHEGKYSTKHQKVLVKCKKKSNIALKKKKEKKRVFLEWRRGGVIQTAESDHHRPAANGKKIWTAKPHAEQLVKCTNESLRKRSMVNKGCGVTLSDLSSNIFLHSCGQRSGLYFDFFHWLSHHQQLLKMKVHVKMLRYVSAE